ncbi:MAG: cysteine desulfurase [Candidatus Doudnabacteria bacterium]|nr:cysteine desulfurase [Candidatus Doudnabacteria bacterium]
MNRIYFDHAATTPLDKRVSKAMRDFELKYFGNPSSVHREGQQARAEIDFGRAAVAKFLNAKPQEIIFTSGATEANNHAIKGIVSKAIFEWGMKPHVITTELEHHSVYNVVKEMEKRGVIEATFIKPTPDGQISADQIIKEIKDNTVLVSCIFVSNEIGSVLPVREIGKHLSSINSRLSTSHKIAFHTDAVQAAKFYNCNVEKLGCDLLTLSAHKLYGPKGIGTLYIKTGTKIDNLMSGGAQEYDMRPGTQNTAGIIGMAKALELLGSLEEREKSAKKIRNLRDELWDQIKNIPGVELNGPIGESRNPENLSITISDIDQDSLITAMDLAGFAVSTGSACVSGSSEPSHVIKALGKAASKTVSTVRFTLGQATTKQEIDIVIKKFPEIINKLRKYNK